MTNTRAAAWLTLTGWFASTGSASAGSTAFLPELAVRLEAARHYSREPDLRWSGRIGAGAGLVRFNHLSAQLSADLETVTGADRGIFDAPQANYHVELAVGRRFGKRDAAVFFHHVSRHDLDRPKEQAVDWNFLGARVLERLAIFGAPGRIRLGIGRATLVSFVRYRWEVTLQTETRLLARGRGSVSLETGTRLVTTAASPASARRRFLDLSAICAARLSRAQRGVGVYLGFERRNDVFLQAPGSRSRALLGIRVDHAGGGALWFP